MAKLKNVDLKKAQEHVWKSSSLVEEASKFAFSESRFVYRTDFDRFVSSLSKYFERFFECECKFETAKEALEAAEASTNFLKLFKAKNENFEKKLDEVYREEESLSPYSSVLKNLVSMIVVPDIHLQIFLADAEN